MSRVFEFDPAEWKVLDTFTFEEEIQRPETTRFYTLDEQVTDYFERLVPAGKVSRFQLEQLQKNADRVRRLYEGLVIPTDEAYEVQTQRPHDGFVPWIVPVYEPLTRTTAHWDDLRALTENGRQPNFMNRLYGGLPRPYSSATGIRTSFTKPQRFVNDKGELPIRAVSEYRKTRGILHEDGRYEVVEEPVANTADDVRLKGYWVEQRELPLIAPLDAHPILGSNEPHFLNMTVPYTDLMPTIDAILTHAIPTTPHPFKDAAPYLKLYDVKWSDIPWTSWKSKFPSADAVSTGIPAEPIEIPQPTRDLPSENLQKNYHVSYRPGLSPRYWLMLQKDGGALASRMMLTQASEAGIVALPNPVQMPEMSQAAAKPEDCLPDNITFDAFVTSGFYRKGMCVPLELIAKERAEVGTKGRKAWTDTTEKEILETYLRLLKDAQGPAPPVAKEPVLPKVEIPELSEIRMDVVRILEDTRRTPEDKAADIRKLVEDLVVKSKYFIDEKGAFVVCQHTLAILEGDLARDRRAFYDAWCAQVEGKRVCKICGEEINRDVLVHQDEFDDEGNVQIRVEEVAAPEFHPGAVQTMTQKLQSLRARFDLDDPAQDMMFLLLSILQILPDQSQLDPVLNQVKKLSAPNKKYGESAQAIYGLIGTVVLMQIHEPFLMPRRSFGRTFLLTGYPREGKPEDPSILDSVVGALKQTYEQFRNVFKGPSKSLIKDAYRESDKVRSKCIQALQIFVKPPQAIVDKLKLEVFTPKLEMAALRYAKAPEVPPELGVLVPNMRIERTELAKVTAAECVPPAKMSFWSTNTPPKSLQAPTTFKTQVPPAITAHRIPPSRSERNVWTPAGNPAERLTALPKYVQKIPLLNRILTENVSSLTWRTASAIAGRLLDRARDAPGIPAEILRGLRRELETLGPGQKAADLRDAARGIAFKILKEVDKVPGLREIWSAELPKDLPLLALVRTLPEVDKEVLLLRTTERTNFVKRLGEMSDQERQLMKDLLDRNMAPYVMTLKDRQLISQQLQERLEREITMPEEVPEEGFPRTREDTERDDADQGERGDYGDMPNRPYEGNDVYGN